jgi:hypothetical protein
LINISLKISWKIDFSHIFCFEFINEDGHVFFGSKTHQIKKMIFVNEKYVQSRKKLNSVNEKNFSFKKMLENSKFSKMFW